MSISQAQFKQIRKELHEDITDSFRKNGGATGVTGWILIVESHNGKEKEFHAVSGDVLGENDIPPWTAQGWLHEVYEEAWPYFGTQSEDEGDDDE